MGSLHLAANRFAEITQSRRRTGNRPRNLPQQIYLSAIGRRAAYSSRERMARSFTFRWRRALMMACAALAASRGGAGRPRSSGPASARGFSGQRDRFAILVPARKRGSPVIRSMLKARREPSFVDGL
jgi:hypothetical protein